VIWLMALLVELLRGRMPPARSETVEIAGLYWHFVDIVWIVIFTLIYLIN
jgi:heme/copper-type cytochrome/quinol oxidase subunit 3